MSLKDILKNKLKENKDNYIKVLKDLVKIDTRVVGHGIDGGYELNGQKYLEELINEMGGKIEYVEMKEKIIQNAIEKYNEGNPGHNYEDRPNLVGKFSGSGGGSSLILNEHID